MPGKIARYLIQHSLIGILLSATAVLGFSYFLSFPGLKGDFLTRFMLANEQLMLISHLIMPLVILIGLAYGLGLLHNHSEIVQIIQQFKSLVSMGFIIIIFLLFTVLSELFVWPAMEAPKEENSPWVKIGNIYTDLTTTFLKTNQNKIISFTDDTHTLGTQPNKAEIILNHRQSVTTNSIWHPKNTKEKYSFWRLIHQAIWPIPLFLLLWLKLNATHRGSNAASIAGSVAMHSIALGLLAESTHIVLTKALFEPWLTGILPCFLISIYILFNHIIRNQ